MGRDRTRCNKIPLEKLISMQTKETAELVGLTDRRLIEPGYKADINIIDFDNLTLHEPTVVYDLPAGGRRLIQKASGYTATVVSGRVSSVQPDRLLTGFGFRLTRCRFFLPGRGLAGLSRCLFGSTLNSFLQLLAFLGRLLFSGLCLRT